MLTESFAAIRAREFAQLDAEGLAYLDYTGAAIPAASQLRAHAEFAGVPVLGNPHSENGPSQASSRLIEDARARVLAFFNASHSEYDVCFTANTSASIKLVAESFPFRRGSTLLLTADNHNSVNGIAEYARRKEATVATVPLTSELRLRAPAAYLRAHATDRPSLFAFPAQSNFSGVRHELGLIVDAQKAGYRVLLDAAAYVPSSALDLSAVRPDFVALSFYKMFGFPTGVGALIVRRDALRELERPWFAGGTVEWASVQNRTHRLRTEAPGFEDGTPNFYGIGALGAGIDFLERVGVARISAHVSGLVALARRDMAHARHENGAPIFRIYGPSNGLNHGGTIAVNLLDQNGDTIPYEHVERMARDHRIAVRGGCFCNPGASERAFAMRPRATARCLRRSAHVPFSPRLLGECLGRSVAVGAVRLSVGVATSEGDVSRGVAALVSIACVGDARRAAS